MGIAINPAGTSGRDTAKLFVARLMCATPRRSLPTYTCANPLEERRHQDERFRATSAPLERSSQLRRSAATRARRVPLRARARRRIRRGRARCRLAQRHARPTRSCKSFDSSPSSAMLASTAIRRDAGFRGKGIERRNHSARVGVVGIVDQSDAANRDPDAVVASLRADEARESALIRRSSESPSSSAPAMAAATFARLCMPGIRTSTIELRRALRVSLTSKAICRQGPSAAAAAASIRSSIARRQTNAAARRRAQRARETLSPALSTGRAPRERAPTSSLRAARASP